ncbi:MAG: NAD(+) synthase [candidate division WOR-3 bacterium]
MRIIENFKDDLSKTVEDLKRFIKTEVERQNKDGVVIGISGGIDSAVCAYLAVNALGKNQVLGLILPERDTNPPSLEDALLVCQALAIDYKKIDMTKVLTKIGIYRLVSALGGLVPYRIKANYARKRLQKLQELTGGNAYQQNLLGFKQPELRKATAYYRAKNRLRLLYLYYYAELKNLLVVGTTNRTEYLIGFFVKYGDGAADIMPLLNLYKTQVWELAKFLSVPKRIIEKVPSPDLIPGLNDEEIIGLNYLELDLILLGYDSGQSSEAINKSTGVPIEKVEYVLKLIRNSESFRQHNLHP